MACRTVLVSSPTWPKKGESRYQLGFCLGLEEMRLGEYVGVADPHLAKQLTQRPRQGRAVDANRLLVELLLLAPPDNHELLQTLLLPLVEFLCLQLQLLLLLLVDVRPTALGRSRRALGEGAE